MKASEAILKMAAKPEETKHDIAHFLKVYAYARTIGEAEGLDPQTQNTLELTAAVHDISCPLCRQKYGNTNHQKQEEESEALVREFFAGTDVSAQQLERIVFLVSHHHTVTGVDGPDYRILLEADFLVNADESSYTDAQIAGAKKTFFRTACGLKLLNDIFGI